MHCTQVSTESTQSRTPYLAVATHQYKRRGVEPDGYRERVTFFHCRLRVERGRRLEKKRLKAEVNKNDIQGKAKRVAEGEVYGVWLSQ